MGVFSSTAKRAFIFAVMLVGVYFLARGIVELANLWMLAFGSVVVAVVLRAIADPLVQRLRWRDGWAVLVSVLVVICLLTAAGFLFGSQISAQVDQLTEAVPNAWNELQARIRASPAGDQILAQMSALGEQAGAILMRAPHVVMTALSAVTTLVLVVVAGIFLAIQPGAARDGLLAVMPLSWRPRGREVLDACGGALKGWLRAQIVSMILVGSVVGVGVWLIGVPAPLALGLLAGLAQFVPIVGPIAAAVPALLLSATGGLQTFALTLALFVGVSQLEANLITPLVQKNVASLPVVLGIFSVVGLGTLFGPLGVLFATPLALVLLTMVNMLYRRDLLGDAEAQVPGERPAKSD